MPELPEVETIIQNLRRGNTETPSAIGQTFASVQVLWSKSIVEPKITQFERQLPDQMIMDIRRRGKFLHFPLSSDHLIIHLRMSGDLSMTNNTKPNGKVKQPDPHDRVLFHFQNGWRLAFKDTRKFGRIWLVPDPELVFGNLGPEPLDHNFTAEDLFMRLSSHKRQLKPLLMDQSFLAGLGNIYTDEALHLAKLHPLRRSNTISPEEAKILLNAIRSILKEGIRMNGASIDWAYRGGDFQNYFRVYHRTGEACPECGTTIERIKVGQRSTHFCPQCQVLAKHP